MNQSRTGRTSIQKIPGLLLFLVLFFVACQSPPDESVSAPAEPQPIPPPVVLETYVEEKIGLKFIRIPAGSFQMGSPTTEEGRSEDEGRHEVTLTRDYWLSETEVTHSQWNDLMDENPSPFPDDCEDCPVAGVSWIAAVTYANLLSAEAGLEPCYEEYEGSDSGFRLIDFSCSGYRLPTEAEWEYAARAGSLAARYGEPDAIAWYKENSSVKIHPVATKAPNAWGLYDMFGNTSEWTNDRYGAYPSGAVEDPTGSETAQIHVYRGGSLADDASVARAANRLWILPTARFADLGFRLARSSL